MTTRNQHSSPANSDDFLTKLVETFFNQVFSFSRPSGLARLTLFVVFFLIAWTMIAFLVHPPDSWGLGFILQQSERDPISTLILALWLILTKSYFAWDVIAPILAILFPLIIAFEYAAIYQDDIFEINDTRVTRSYIKQAAFSLPIDPIMNPELTIHIENGDIRESDRNSRIFRIGGPGRVIISYENVAIFEKINGELMVIGPPRSPQDGVYELDGFERLRSVIDLRDQTIQFDISNRTKDGILITIKGIRIIFSVLRPKSSTRTVTPGEIGSTDASSEAPYSYDEEAIRHLVIEENVDPLESAMKGLVQGEFKNFISDHTLSDIISAIGITDISKLIAQGTSGGDIPINIPNYVPRTQISQRFSPLSEEFHRRARNKGIQLEWIDVGTWYVPAEIVPKQNQEAWQITMENRARRSNVEFHQLRRQAYEEELNRATQDVIITYLENRQQQLPVEDSICNLYRVYAGKLNQSLTILQAQENREEEIAQIQQSLEKIHQILVRCAETKGYHFL